MSKRTFTVTEPDSSYLARLVELGYGETPSEVLAYLLRRGIDDLIRAGVLIKKAKQ